MNENKPIRNTNTSRKKDDPGKKKDIRVIITVVIAVEIVLAVFLGIYLYKRSYESAKTNTTANIRKGAYDTVYGIAEKANHVSNRVTLSLDGIREKADLEVLQVESEYIYVSDEEDKGKKLTIWYKIPGTGFYTIDMRMAEYIFDPERHQVHIVAPQPSITIFKENSKDIKPLFYHDGKFKPIEGNGSIKEGTEIAQKIMAQAGTQMLKDLNMNRAYYEAAEDSAERLITNMIKAVNPTIPDLKVTVEFKKGTAG